MAHRPRSQRDAPRAVRLFVFFPLSVLLALAFTVPLLWMAVSSLRPENEIFAHVGFFDPRTWIPSSLSVRSYVDAFNGSFGVGLRNSLITSAGAVVIGLPVSALAAFGLSVARFRGQGVLLGVTVIGFLIPFDAIAVPLFHYFDAWGLRDSYAGLILPAVGNGLAIFILRQFFLGIPRELPEAMQIDGAGWLRIFTTLYLPLSKGALVGASTILFMFQWNSYLWPLLIAPSADKQIAPVALAAQLGQFQQFFSQLFAGTVILSIVPAAILLATQRVFTRSLAVGSATRGTH